MPDHAAQQLADMAEALIRQEAEIAELEVKLASARQDAIEEVIGVLQAARSLEDKHRVITLIRAMLAQPRDT